MNIKKFLCLFLIFALAICSFSAMAVDIPWQDDDDEPIIEIGSGEEPDADDGYVSSYRVTFKGTETGIVKDSPVMISVDLGEVIPEAKIPAVKTPDEFYDFKGWALESDAAKVIDLDAYKVNKEITLVPVTEDTWKPYSDMAQDRSDWYYTYVRDLSVANVVGGRTDGTFSPSGTLTWGEALKLTMLATGYEVQAPTGAHWASGYLTKAQSDALVGEVENLDAPITRLEVAELAYKCMKLAAPTGKTPFPDTDAQSVTALYEAGIITGTTVDGKLVYNPDANIIRSEISAIIWRINNYKA